MGGILHEAGQVVNDIIPGTPAAAADDVDGPVEIIGQTAAATGQTAGSVAGEGIEGTTKGLLASGPGGIIGLGLLGLAALIALGGLGD